jgi:hypothetical protein
VDLAGHRLIALLGQAEKVAEFFGYRFELSG